MGVRFYFYSHIINRFYIVNLCSTNENDILATT